MIQTRNFIAELLLLTNIQLPLIIQCSHQFGTHPIQLNDDALLGILTRPGCCIAMVSRFGIFGRHGTGHLKRLE